MHEVVKIPAITNHFLSVVLVVHPFLVRPQNVQLACETAYPAPPRRYSRLCCNSEPANLDVNFQYVCFQASSDYLSDPRGKLCAYKRVVPGNSIVCAAVIFEYQIVRFLDEVHLDDLEAEKSMI
jgi:hypothetical protein